MSRAVLTQDIYGVIAGLQQDVADLKRDLSVARGSTYVLDGLSAVDVVVPEGSGLATVDFEYLTSGLASGYLRPNGSSSGMKCVDHFVSSTSSPDTVTHNAQIGSRSGLWMPVAGASGRVSVVGSATLQLAILGSSSRRVGSVRGTITNTVGSGNFYVYNWLSSAVLDDAIGTTTAITSIRLALDSGTFSDGIMTVRFS